MSAHCPLGRVSAVVVLSWGAVLAGVGERVFQVEKPPQLSFKEALGTIQGRKQWV